MVGVDDGAGGFFAEDLGLWRGVKACAEVSAVYERNQDLEEWDVPVGMGGMVLRVDVVDADDVVLDEDLAFFGFGDW